MATRRATRPAGPPAPPVCRCRTWAHPLLVVATFRNGDLAAVERRHWRGDGCTLEPEHVDPDVYTGRRPA